MKIGFLGTLREFTQVQRDLFIDTIIKFGVVEEFHHGDCVGSDENAHNIIRLIAPDCEICVHPPVREMHRAYCEGDVDFVQMDYIARNQEIVDFSDVVVACIHEFIKGQARSGANDPWRAIEYAKSQKIHTIIINNEGKVKEHFSGKTKPRYI